MSMRMRHVRVSDELWESMQKAAADRGEKVSDALRGFMADYVAENLPGYTAGFVAGADAVTKAVTTAIPERPSVM